MWAKHRQSGFTIVELLIVVVVIAILAALTLVVYNNTNQRARDSERLTELNSLQKAIELYHAENGGCPKCGSTGPNTPAVFSANTVQLCLADELVPNYIAALPVAPINDGTLYTYRYGAGFAKTGDTTFNTTTPTDSYILGVKQETVSAPTYSGWGQPGLTLLIGS